MSSRVARRIGKATVALLGIAFLSGCESGALRRTTLLLVDEIEVYEEQVDAKIAAERSFYRGVQKALYEAAERQVYITSETERLERALAFVDGLLIEQRGVSFTRLRGFLDETEAAQEAAFEDSDRRLAEARRNWTISFARLSDVRSQLAKTKRALVDVSKPRSAKEQAKQLYELGKDVREKLEELEQAEGTATDGSS
jgi:hypothetical protein